MQGGWLDAPGTTILWRFNKSYRLFRIIVIFSFSFVFFSAFLHMFRSLCSSFLRRHILFFLFYFLLLLFVLSVVSFSMFCFVFSYCFFLVLIFLGSSCYSSVIRLFPVSSLLLLLLLLHVVLVFVLPSYSSVSCRSRLSVWSHCLILHPAIVVVLPVCLVIQTFHSVSAYVISVCSFLRSVNFNLFFPAICSLFWTDTLFGPFLLSLKSSSLLVFPAVSFFYVLILPFCSCFQSVNPSSLLILPL